MASDRFGWLATGMNEPKPTDPATPPAASPTGAAAHPDEPHTGALAGRLNWLRAA